MDPNEISILKFINANKTYVVFLFNLNYVEITNDTYFYKAYLEYMLIKRGS
jgi:hypothetical protein